MKIKIIEQLNNLCIKDCLSLDQTKKQYILVENFMIGGDADGYEERIIYTGKLTKELKNKILFLEYNNFNDYDYEDFKYGKEVLEFPYIERSYLSFQGYSLYYTEKGKFYNTNIIFEKEEELLFNSFAKNISLGNLEHNNTYIPNEKQLKKLLELYRKDLETDAYLTKTLKYIDKYKISYEYIFSYIIEKTNSIYGLPLYLAQKYKLNLNFNYKNMNLSLYFYIKKPDNYVNIFNDNFIIYGNLEINYVKDKLLKIKNKEILKNLIKKYPILLDTSFEKDYIRFSNFIQYFLYYDNFDLTKFILIDLDLDNELLNKLLYNTKYDRIYLSTIDFAFKFKKFRFLNLLLDNNININKKENNINIFKNSFYKINNKYNKLEWIQFLINNLKLKLEIDNLEENKDNYRSVEKYLEPEYLDNKLVNLYFYNAKENNINIIDKNNVNYLLYILYKNIEQKDLNNLLKLYFQNLTFKQQYDFIKFLIFNLDIETLKHLHNLNTDLLKKLLNHKEFSIPFGEFFINGIRKYLNIYDENKLNKNINLIYTLLDNLLSYGMYIKNIDTHDNSLTVFIKEQMLWDNYYKKLDYSKIFKIISKYPNNYEKDIIKFDMKKIYNTEFYGKIYEIMQQLKIILYKLDIIKVENICFTKYENQNLYFNINNNYILYFNENIINPNKLKKEDFKLKKI